MLSDCCGTEEHYFEIYREAETNARTAINNKIKEIEKSLEECAKWVLFLTVSVIAILMIEYCDNIKLM